MDTNTNTTHAFEAAGLGKAPFQFVGAYELRGPITYTDPKTGVEVQVGSPGQPMGTCAYCGTGIAYCCTIQSADGRTFVVGTDCVERTHSADGRRAPITEQSRAAVRELIRERNAATAAAKAATRAAERRAEQRNIARGLVAALPVDARTALRTHRVLDIVKSFRLQLATGKELTQRQLQVLVDLAIPEADVPVTDKRVLVKGTLVKVAHVQDHYSYAPRTVCKITLRVNAADGSGSYRLWGTAPVTLFDQLQGYMIEECIGSTIEFVARIQRGSRQPSFGFFSRPAKARMVELVATTSTES